MTQIRCYCGKWNDLNEEDLGSEDFTCSCGFVMCIPETFEEITVCNDELNETLQTVHEKSVRYRIMVEGEDGTEFCVRNNLQNDDLLDVLVDGFRVRYPEARRVFTEPEEYYHKVR